MPWLINAAQLDKFRKSQKNVVVFDASWHLSQANRSAKEEFLNHHIVGARFLDLDAFHQQETILPNMLIQDQKKLAEWVGALGVTNDHKIIFYDQSELHTSCRALWMFKVFGHDPNQLYVLDGGFAAFEKYGGKIETGEPRSIATKSYAIYFANRFIRTLSQMKDNLHDPKEQVIDMRHPIRYAGGGEHREGLRSGHIPGSFSFPYFTMFENEGRFKPLEKIRKQLTGIGVSLASPIITTCGSGMTAAILNFILDLMNHEKHSLYDGSWAEWGAGQLYSDEDSLDERPVETSIEG